MPCAQQRVVQEVHKEKEEDSNTPPPHPTVFGATKCVLCVFVCDCESVATCVKNPFIPIAFVCPSVRAVWPVSPEWLNGVTRGWRVCVCLCEKPRTEFRLREGGGSHVQTALISTFGDIASIPSAGGTQERSARAACG